MSIGCYRIVVEGELGSRYASAFNGMQVHSEQGQTEITGPITDRSHLQGILDRISDLGLTLKSVNKLGTAGEIWNAPDEPQASTSS